MSVIGHEAARRMVSDETRARFVNPLIALFLASVVVLPNSPTLRLAKLPLVLIVAVIVVLGMRRIEREYLVVLALGIAVTLVYLLVGLRGSPDPTAALIQVSAAYIVAPIFWIYLGDHLFRKYHADSVVRLFVVLSILATLTVAGAYWALQNDSAHLLFFMVEGGIRGELSEEAVGISLQVFGSLIFLGAAVFGRLADRLDPLHLLAIAAIAASALVANRSALIVALLIGASMLVVQMLIRARLVRLVLVLPIVFGVAVAIMYFGAPLIGIDVEQILFAFRDEVAAGGGSARTEQMGALLGGIADNALFGSGHGVGVDVIRDEDRPWAYEVIALSTIYKVGVLGALIYLVPAMLSLVRYWGLVRAGRSESADHFFAFGLLGTLAATFTNPYLESVEFQWTYFLPYAYFVCRAGGSRGSKGSRRRRRRRVSRAS